LLKKTWEEKMVRETKRHYRGVALPASEIDALQELEQLLQQSIPLL
jgi:hypothetical protein